MILEAGALFVALAAGFGLGRVKNAAKLAAVKAEIAKAEAAVETDAKKVIAAVKAKL